MTLTELFQRVTGAAVDRTGIDLLQDRLSEGSRRALGEVSLGRAVVCLSQAVAGSPLLSPPVANQQRQRALIGALREVAALMILYGMAPEDVERLVSEGAGG